MRKILVLGSALLLFAGLSSAQSSRQIKATYSDGYNTKQEIYIPSFKEDGKQTKVRNVILLIGDGMGFGSVNAAMYANGGLTMTSLQAIGFVRTQSTSAFNTDSAASGTAYATGHKTSNNSLGVDSKGERLDNICEKLAPLGYISGIVTTDRITGATPAAFYAHNAQRSDDKGIWQDFAASNFGFVAAGSKKHYNEVDGTTQDAIKNKYNVVHALEDYQADGKPLVYLPVSTGSDRGDFLPSCAQLAIEHLTAQSNKGFFLMVEGATIDHKAHNNNAETLVADILDFDKAVEAAVRFAEQDGHTLVIVTADHETGMANVNKADAETGYASMHFAHKGHSGMMVPLFAYGPHSKDFVRVQENSDVGNMIYALLTARK